MEIKKTISDRSKILNFLSPENNFIIYGRLFIYIESLLALITKEPDISFNIGSLSMARHTFVA